jgi:hypothetical protein
MSIPFNARSLQEADVGTPLEVLSPVLFNTFKHHAGALRCRITSVAAAGPGALADLGSRMAVLGTKLMDLYIGQLTPREISTRVLELLRAQGRLERESFRAWLAEQNDYLVVPFAEDESRWVLRMGDEHARYIHLHPGRWSPATIRVRANVLKTAFLVLAHVRIYGGQSMDRKVINEVRQQHLGLSPLGQDPEGEAGLGAVLEVLGQQ